MAKDSTRSRSGPSSKLLAARPPNVEHVPWVEYEQLPGEILRAGCTLGINAWVHYGVKMGDGAQLAADAFLMKGTQVPSDTRWGNNPARIVARMRRVSSNANEIPQ